MRCKELFIGFLLLGLAGCMDRCTKKKAIPGPYTLIKDESEWGLYYNIGEDSWIGRINSLKEIAWTERYIFARYDSFYYFIDKTRDNMYYNSEEITLGPFNKTIYDRFIDSLNLVGLQLQKP